MDYINSAKDTLTSGVQNLSQGLDNAKQSVGSSIDAFSSKSMIDASGEFLAANSMIAKFVFIIFVLVIFMVLFSLGSALIAYLLSPTRTPQLVTGKRGGGRQKTISQDPRNKESQIIYRSNNAASGIEFTWSIWLRIDGVRPKINTKSASNEYDHIFHKGDMNFISGADTVNVGLSMVNNGPGMYVRRASNDLLFIMNVVSPVNGTQLPDKELEIKNIPLAKWFHVSLRLQNRVLDAYVNGVIANRVTFAEVPKQNFDDVHIASNGGFLGELADLRYFDRSLSVFELNSIVNRGPNLAMSDDSDGNPGEYDYLSSLWYNSIWKTSV
jgi:hypothetical protein